MWYIARSNLHLYQCHPQRWIYYEAWVHSNESQIHDFQKPTMKQDQRKRDQTLAVRRGRFSYLPLRRLIIRRCTAVDGQCPLSMLNTGAMLNTDDDRLVKLQSEGTSDDHWTQHRLTICKTRTDKTPELPGRESLPLALRQRRAVLLGFIYRSWNQQHS